MKVKFGTQLEENIYEQLKVASARQKQPIGEIVQEALDYYLHRSKATGNRKSGLARLLSRTPFKISDEQFRASMEEDCWEQ